MCIGWLDDAIKENRFKISSLEIEVDAERIHTNIDNYSRSGNQLSDLKKIETEIMELLSKVDQFFNAMRADLELRTANKEDYDHNGHTITDGILDSMLQVTMRIYEHLQTVSDDESVTSNADATAMKEMLGKIEASVSRIQGSKQLASIAAKALFNQLKFGRVAVTKNRRTGRGKVHNWSYNGTRFGEYVHRAAKHSIKIPNRAWSA